MLALLIEYMPDDVRVTESEIEVDGSWLAERIITKMPIEIFWKRNPIMNKVVLVLLAIFFTTRCSVS